MHVSLEYIALGILIIVFLVATMYVIQNTMSKLNQVYEEQLYPVTQRILDKILLTTGYPADWGDNLTAIPEDFGLALNGTRTSYVVDDAKVMRLTNFSTIANPAYINASTIAELLGVEGKYGFRLEIKPFLNQTMDVLATYPVPNRKTPDIPVYILVTVKNWYNIGVPNANVTAQLVLVRINFWPNGSVKDLNYTTFTRSNVTGPLGTCTVDFRDDLADYFSAPGLGAGGAYRVYSFVTLYTNWSGFLVLSAIPTQALVDAPVSGYLIGDYVVINRTLSVIGAVRIRNASLQVIPSTFSVLQVANITWLDTTSPPFGLLRPWQDYLVGKVEGLDPYAAYLLIFATWRGYPIIITVSRVPNVDLWYGQPGALPPNSVTLTRVVQIGLYPYLVRLTVWRLAEGYP